MTDTSVPGRMPYNGEPGMLYKRALIGMADSMHAAGEDGGEGMGCMSGAYRVAAPCAHVQHVTFAPLCDVAKSGSAAAGAAAPVQGEGVRTAEKERLERKTPAA